MPVGTYALTSADEAFAYIGEDASRDALWIYYDGANATATVEVQDNALVLTDSATHSFDLTNVAYDTIGELVTGIVAISGWHAGSLYHPSAASLDLEITGAVNAKDEANEQTLKIKDVYLIEKLIDRATDFIERFCNRKLKTRSYSRESYWGNGRQMITLDQYPVTAVSRVSYGRTNAFSIKNTTATNNATAEITASILSLVADGAAATTFTLSSYAIINLLLAAINLTAGWSATLLDSSLGTRKATDLLIRPAMYCLSPAVAYGEIPDDELTEYMLINPSEDRNAGILQCPSAFTAGIEFWISYTAGYTPIPYALEAACLELVKYKYNQSKKDGALRSESLGDYSYTIGDFNKGIPDDLKNALDFFKRRIF